MGQEVGTDSLMWGCSQQSPDDLLMKSNIRGWKTFMGGFSASSKFQGKILQSLDSKSPLAPYSPVSERKEVGFHRGWGSQR